MKINTSHNYDYRDHKKPANTDPSMTIPGESYTIRELIKRHSQGMTDNNQHHGEYQEEVDHNDPDIQKLQRIDMVDRNELTATNQGVIDKLRTNIEDKKAQKAFLKQQEEVKAKLDNIPKVKKSEGSTSD